MDQTGHSLESAMVESRWRTIRNLLKRDRRRIIEEVDRNPQPIAGSDLQFSHLLEQRTAIQEELHRFHEHDDVRRSMSRLDEFARSSSFMDDR